MRMPFYIYLGSYIESIYRKFKVLYYEKYYAKIFYRHLNHNKYTLVQAAWNSLIASAALDSNQLLEESHFPHPNGMMVKMLIFPLMPNFANQESVDIWWKSF